MEREIVINNELTEITKVARFIEELGLSLQLPASIVMSVDLAVEEAITNIIHYGYPMHDSSEIILRANLNSGVLTFLIIDDGISFDLSEKDASNVTLSLEQRLVDGLGISLIRRTMDEVNYHTVDAQNYLTLIKKTGVVFKDEVTMKTNICKIEDVTILTIEGRLDTLNASEFSIVIQPLLADASPNIIINCEGMTYISSSGLRNFILLQKSVQQHHGRLTIEAMRPEIRKIFDMTGCSTLFAIR